MRWSQICVLSLTILTTSAHAAPIRVDWSGGADYTTIQQGLDAASAGDTVLVAPGTYTGPENRNLDFGGVNIVLMSEAGQLATTIDCEREGRGFFLPSGLDDRSLIHGFTVTNGLADFGGGMWCFNSSPAVVNCTFRDNEAQQGGGIFCGDFSVSKIVECTFTDNIALEYGGAIYFTKCFPSVKSCTFEGNEAAFNGGAMSIKDGAAVVVSSSTFTDNFAPDGGAVFASMTDSMDTRASHDRFATPVLKNCKFSYNTAERGGAVHIGGFSSTTVTFCTFAHNTAFEDGGALYCLTSYVGTPQIVNCTLCMNSADKGGGIFTAADVDYNYTKVINTIIAFSSGGGAMVREFNSAAETTRCVAYENEGGDELWGAYTLVADPLFCDLNNQDLNYMLCSNSICLKVNNPWDYLIGAHYQGCGSCESPVEGLSWGAIKAMYR